MTIYNLVSLFGIVVLLGIAFLFSNNRNKINYRIIYWGIGIQIIFAVFIFLIPVGAKFFLYLNDIVVQIMNSSAAGAKFLFGRLAPSARYSKWIWRDFTWVLSSISSSSYNHLFFSFSIHSLFLWDHAKSDKRILLCFYKTNEDIGCRIA